MLADDYNCDKCRGLCGEFVKIWGDGRAASILKCKYSDCNFVLTAYPTSGQVYRLDLLYEFPVHMPTIEGVVDFLLLNWKELQLEDAIRLAKVDKNVG